jgi:DNA repair exonuclease SbcCD nuclease subunit
MKYDFIAISDLHLRDDVPKCRTDDFKQVQNLTLYKIYEIAQHNGYCPILIAGDIFHKWNPSLSLVRETFIALNREENIKIFAVAGQHDLPNHNIDLIDKTGLGLLCQFIDIVGDFACFVGDKSYWGCSWDGEINKDICKNNKNVLIVHKLLWHKNKPFPEATQDSSAEVFMKKHPEFKVIISGDNHETFVVKTDNQLLINCGSCTRQKADQIDHIPKAFGVNVDTLEYEEILLPDQERDAVTRIYIEEEKERDEKIDKFVSTLVMIDEKIGLSFRENILHFISSNDIIDVVKSKILESLENKNVEN